jgi:tetratricopeptide (TPR) repeat protein
MMHGKRGNTKEALDALASAQMLNPRFEMTFVYRGNVFLSAGEPSAAINEFNRALEINPRNDAARDGLRVAQSQLTRPPR